MDHEAGGVLQRIPSPPRLYRASTGLHRPNNGSRRLAGAETQAATAPAGAALLAECFSKRLTGSVKAT